MKTTIVAAVGRGHLHASQRDLSQLVIDPIFAGLMKVYKDRSLPQSLRDQAYLWAFQLRPIRGASLGNTFENDLMKLIFGAVAIANIADNAASAPLTSLYTSLHTADPGETGDQTTSETTYTSYVRLAAARDTSTASRWVVTNNIANPNQNFDFAAGTGGSGTVTHFAVGTASSGAGKLLLSGTVSPNITVGNGVTPRLTTSTAITAD